MSLQFSRSLRALHVDSYRPSQIGLLLAILIMGGLIAWFFLVKVTLFENSTSLEFSEDGRILAAFTPEAMKRIRQGQSATLRIDAGTDRPAIGLPATVFQIEPGSEKIQILALSNQISPGLKTSDLTGRVEVEVEYATPAQLLLRISGKYFGNSNIPVSPQTTGQGLQESQ